MSVVRRETLSLHIITTEQPSSENLKIVCLGFKGVRKFPTLTARGTGNF